MVSSSTVEVCPGVSMAFSVAAISVMPVSTPCPVWLPGWKLYTFPGTYSIRSRSSAMVSRANSRVRSSLEQGLMVYGAWATSVPNPFSLASARNASASLGSMALALLPRGLRVKN